MIGKLLCKVGMHTGQDRGGLAFFTCLRCDRTLHQTSRKYAKAMSSVKALEDIGRNDEAWKVYQDTMPNAPQEGLMLARIPHLVDQLVSDLMKPTYPLNMARQGEHRKDAMGKSCRTRAANARKEIDRIVRDYVKANPKEDK